MIDKDDGDGGDDDDADVEDDERRHQLNVSQCTPGGLTPTKGAFQLQPTMV